MTSASFLLVILYEKENGHKWFMCRIIQAWFRHIVQEQPLWVTETRAHEPSPYHTPEVTHEAPVHNDLGRWFLNLSALRPTLSSVVVHNVMCSVWYAPCSATVSYWEAPEATPGLCQARKLAEVCPCRFQSALRKQLEATSSQTRRCFQSLPRGILRPAESNRMGPSRASQ